VVQGPTPVRVLVEDRGQDLGAVPPEGAAHQAPEEARPPGDLHAELLVGGGQPEELLGADDAHEERDRGGPRRRGPVHQ